MLIYLILLIILVDVKFIINCIKIGFFGVVNYVEKGRKYRWNSYFEMENKIEGNFSKIFLEVLLKKS